MKSVTISPTSVTPTWKSNTTTSNSMGGVKSMNENQQMGFANQTGDNSTDSSPGSNGTSGDTTVGKMSSAQEWSWTVLLILYPKASSIQAAYWKEIDFCWLWKMRQDTMWFQAQEFRWQDPLILRSCVFWDILTVSNCLVFKKSFIVFGEYLLFC